MMLSEASTLIEDGKLAKTLAEKAGERYPRNPQERPKG